MLTENQQKWLAALRSGKYAQGQCDLHRGDRFCCLGVAAELFKTPETKIETYKGENGPLYVYDENTTVAPDYVIEALGLLGGFGNKRDEESGAPRYTLSLAQLNDTGKSFAEIADIFEANLSEYTK